MRVRFRKVITMTSPVVVRVAIRGDAVIPYPPFELLLDLTSIGVCYLVGVALGAARSRRPPLPEIVLWSTAVLHPSESQTSECSDLLSRSRATCLIVAQRQPGKLIIIVRHARTTPRKNGMSI